MLRRTAVGPAVALVLLASAACDDDTDSSNGETRSPEGESRVIVFNGEGNNLNAYDAEPPFEKQTVIRNHDDAPERGLDINAQICFFPDGSGRFIAGEDTNQPDPPPGWGIFDLDGSRVGDLSARQIGKLTPTYQVGTDNPENYGCGFLSDGRVVTTDIGNQAGGPRTGQLIVWFPPFDSRDVRYCKIDTAIGTAGQLYVDDQDRVYVASALDNPAGIRRYSGPFPSSPDANGGCGKADSTGAPLADAAPYELFISTEQNLSTPYGIVSKADGGFYASSVFTGVINEYDANGEYVRTVLSPPANETLGDETYSTGTPLGLGIDSDGTLYYADIGITAPAGETPGPGPVGTVRRIRFVRGEPQAPEVMGGELAFPDGIGVYEPRVR